MENADKNKQLMDIAEEVFRSWRTKLAGYLVVITCIIVFVAIIITILSS